jgi:hypothetical protein
MRSDRTCGNGLSYPNTVPRFARFMCLTLLDCDSVSLEPIAQVADLGGLHTAWNIRAPERRTRGLPVPRGSSPSVSNSCRTATPTAWTSAAAVRTSVAASLLAVGAHVALPLRWQSRARG